MIPHVSVGVVVVTLALTGFFATISRVSSLILRGLRFYILPEESDKTTSAKGNGSFEKEADAGGEKLKKKGGKKKKEKDVFDEGGAQILRIRMENAQLESRKYFQEYDESVIYTLLGLASFTSREILFLIANSNLAKERGWTETLTPDDRVSFIVSVFAVFKLIRLLAKVNYDPQLARKSERLLNWISGIIGFVVASCVLMLVPTPVLDFGINDAVVDAGRAVSLFMQKKGSDFPNEVFISATIVKLMLASIAAGFSSILVGPTLRNAKSFWAATDQLGWNITLLKRSSLARPFLNLAVVLPLLVTLLWVKPILPLVHPTSSLVGSNDVLKLGILEETIDLGYSDPFFNDLSRAENPRVRDAKRLVSADPGADLFGKAIIDYQHGMEEGEDGGLGRIFISRQYDWTERLGVSEDSFGGFRLWLLLLTGLLQVSLLRVNLQTYCDGSVLLWYQGLHQGKAHNQEITKAKIFLNNYFVCRIALQSLVPGVLVLLMLGLARSRGSHLDSLVQEGKYFFAPSFVRAFMHFNAWWLVFMPAVQSWVILALFRLGLLTSTY